MKKSPGENLYKLHIFWKNYSLYIKIIHRFRFCSPEDTEPVWWNNLTMQSESLSRMRNDELLGRPRLINLIIFSKFYSFHIKIIEDLTFRSPQDSVPVWWNNLFMQSESLSRMRNDELLGRPRLINLIIFQNFYSF